MRGLEEAIIVLLAGLGIAAETAHGPPGLYVGGDKIASVGLRCQRWVASHGTSLNVSIDLPCSTLIVSCGEPELRQTSIAALTGAALDMADIKQAYIRGCYSKCSAGSLLPAADGARYDRGGGLDVAGSERCPRQDSNLRHLAPEASALSPELRGREEIGAALPRAGRRRAIIPVRAAASPFSGYGTTRISRSRGSSAPGNTARASSRSSLQLCRELRWVSTSVATPAARATSAASRAVE